MARVTSWIKAIVRIVHPSPIWGKSCRTMLGNARPPTVAPAAVIPNASERRLAKYVDVTAMVGQKRHPLPRPRHIPCARKNCQYVLQNEAATIPSTTRKKPTMKRGRKKPMSVQRPVKVPTKNSRKTSKEPIHDTSDGERSNRVVKYGWKTPKELATPLVSLVSPSLQQILR